MAFTVCACLLAAGGAIPQARALEAPFTENFFMSRFLAAGATPEMTRMACGILQSMRTGPSGGLNVPRVGSSPCGPALSLGSLAAAMSQGGLDLDALLANPGVMALLSSLSKIFQSGSLQPIVITIQAGSAPPTTITITAGSGGSAKAQPQKAQGVQKNKAIAAQAEKPKLSPIPSIMEISE